MTGFLDARSTWRVGVALMVAALVAAIVTGVPAAAEETTTEVEIDQLALLTSPANDVVPDTLVSQFPPQVSCVLFPEICAENTEDIRNLIGDLLGSVDENESTAPIQPVQPDTLTMSYVGGTPRYQSAFRIASASLPTEDLDSFSITFPQSQPTFSFESPLFRAAILDIVNLAGSQDPEAFLESLVGRLENEPPLEQPLLSIEACPLTLPIPSGAEPPQSAPILSIEESDGEGGRQPAVDCLYGANGVYDAATETWTFDLTFAAQAWADGTLANLGVLLRPTGAPDLAFGDPDVSSNAQVTFDIADAPTATVVTSEPLPAPSPPPDPEPPAPAESTPPPATDTGNDGTTGGMTPPNTSPPTFSAPNPGTGGGGSLEEPTTAPPQVADGSGSDAVALDPIPVSDPVSTPWVWLILIVFAVGAWLTARSLTAELVVSSAAREGALSRLVEHPLT